MIPRSTNFVLNTCKMNGFGLEGHKMVPHGRTPGTLPVELLRTYGYQLLLCMCCYRILLAQQQTFMETNETYSRWTDGRQAVRV